MRIEPLGDSALLARLSEEFDPERTLDDVLRAAQALERAAVPGVIEIVPAYTTIGIFFDPRQVVPFDELTAAIDRALQSSLEPGRPRSGTGSVIEVPVCYESEFAPDLADVARQSGLQEEEVVRRHSSVSYRVACVGFTPGFPYLSGLPSELATPRRSNPRKEVPAGAVAIGGTQTGVYPRKSPGGWNIIGRTPLRLFEVERQPPAVFRAGDCVRFRRISRPEYEQLSR
jgi:inhibitor of KinA